ncbi:Protein of unknown function [Lactobacillus gigeriorum DSM 23908 = CRBIP 24.85]|uniref:Uncharacterized protein n=1 Tax=Lactobacillus gigeriorum DSM 23908 = CRBIP 24.85 TaxID=1423751 RepID=I7J2I9_9LACO|nr:Protein of unknown function [Lactobacillus gigeriorum DSM 23908 = CRBIP 24.85]
MVETVESLTFTVPPPRSVATAAEWSPLVEIVTFLALIFPP